MTTVEIMRKYNTPVSTTDIMKKYGSLREPKKK